jgi:hypothetical protein
MGGGTPFFTALDNWVNLTLVETRTFPDGVLLTRYEPDLGSARARGRRARVPHGARSGISGSSVGSPYRRY